jgi:sulfide dehydrogenase cytochrome subunit
VKQVSTMTMIKYLVLGILLSSAGPLAGDPLQELIEECEACHGPKGVSDQEDIPSLAGKPAADIKEAIGQFYFYERHCPTTTYRHGDKPASPMNMCNIAGRLNDEEVEALSLYFEAQE